jgi:hypothetical protein
VCLEGDPSRRDGLLARDVRRRLGAANVLEGSVRREGNHVRITAELIKADDGFQLWSQTYDRQINDIFAVQDEIALAATEALQVKLLDGNGQRITSRLRSANPEVYQAYLQAKYFLGRGTSAPAFLSFHFSHRPASAYGCPSFIAMANDCLVFASSFCHS